MYPVPAAQSVRRREARPRVAAMRFISSNALWLLCAVPLLIGAYEWILRRAARDEMVRFTTVALVSRAADERQAMRRRIPPLLFLLGITLLLLAVARPAAVFLLPAQRGSVVLAMDVSLSMAATDVAPSRLGAAQRAAAQFVQRLPDGVRIGIVTFADRVDTPVLPTIDKARVLRGLQQFKIQQQTALGPGLLAALRMIHPAAVIDPKYDTFERIAHAADPQAFYMRGVPPPRYEPKHDPNRAPVDPSTLIVLVSDGHGTIGISAVMAAEVVAHHGIRVYTVGVGTPYGGPAKVEGLAAVHADFQAETLKMVATITGGKYTEADSLNDLEAIYRDLSEGKIRARTEVEISAAFAGCAALLLLAGGTFSLRWHTSVAERVVPPTGRVAFDIARRVRRRLRSVRRQQQKAR